MGIAAELGHRDIAQILLLLRPPAHNTHPYTQDNSSRHGLPAAGSNTAGYGRLSVPEQPALAADAEILPADTSHGSPTLPSSRQEVSRTSKNRSPSPGLMVRSNKVSPADTDLGDGARKQLTLEPGDLKKYQAKCCIIS